MEFGGRGQRQEKSEIVGAKILFSPSSGIGYGDEGSTLDARGEAGRCKGESQRASGTSQALSRRVLDWFTNGGYNPLLSND